MDYFNNQKSQTNKKHMFDDEEDFEDLPTYVICKNPMQGRRLPIMPKIIQSNNQENFCCVQLYLLLEQKDILYDAIKREYFHRILGKAGCQLLVYCFFCGTKLPENLSAVWEETIKKELKIDDPWDALYEETLPEEFMTDQWWKKRGY